MTRILYPVFVQVALTFVLFFWMGAERVKAIRARTVRSGGDKGQKPVWPERAAVISNAFHNQLELPMLFYCAVVICVIGGAVTATTVTLAWAFVLLRLVHAGIHTTYNHVPHRFLAYVAGAVALIALWIALIVYIVTTGQ